MNHSSLLLFSFMQNIAWNSEKKKKFRTRRKRSVDWNHLQTYSHIISFYFLFVCTYHSNSTKIKKKISSLLLRMQYSFYLDLEHKRNICIYIPWLMSKYFACFVIWWYFRKLFIICITNVYGLIATWILFGSSRSFFA